MLFTTVVLILYCTSVDMVRVRVEEGVLEGEVLAAVTGDKKYYSFKGIPYAEPPVGKLRFLAPRPLPCWKGVRSAKQHGPICVQNPRFTFDNNYGTEDCLYLNVYTPDITPKYALPVMVYIFGGAFLFGSGNSNIYGPDFLIRNDVIIVTMNYRVGLFGFLSLDIKEVPGNTGMKDQVAALRWIKKNIKSFGGDSDNVTIFGHSSGAASVSLHLFSPMSKGLFTKAIVLSSGLLNDVFRPFEQTRRGYTVAKQLGLETTNATEVFEFLQGMPVEKLRDVTSNILLSESAMHDIRILTDFVPVVEIDFGDERFLTTDPVKNLQCDDFDCVDLIIGHTNKEGIDSVVSRLSEMLKYYPQYPELLVPLKISRVSSPKKVLRLSKSVHQYYFGNKSIDLSTIDQLVEFYSYYNYVYDIHRFLERWSDKCQNTYSYNFTGYTDRNYFGKQAAKFNLTGASHKDEILYLFNANIFNLTINKNSKGFAIIEKFCTLLTNFAKFSNPTPDNSLGQIWLPHNQNGNYLLIDEQLSTGIDTFTGQLGFWKNLLETAGIEF